MAGRVELAVVAKNQASKALKQVGNDIRDLKEEAGKSKSSLSNMFDIAGGNLLSRGIQSATSAMLGLGKAAIGVVSDMAMSAANMNAQVSGIGAVLGLTTEELTKVKGLINELGVDPNLKVNAQEAADAIDMLARNGLTLDQILGGAARATVFLANATGGSFDTSANVATDVMAMFKIRAEDMMTAVDGITSVTVASKFGLDDYRLAIAQAGGVASALGVNFEDFNTSIAATSSSFASGSDAGTSFKTFLQRLVPQSNEAVDAMGELGLYGFNAEKAMTTLSSMGIKPLSNDMGSLIDQLMKGYAATHKVNLSTDEGLQAFNDWARQTGFVQNAFYDANGQMKSMADISATLNQATAGLTEEQKNQYLTTIFGSDAMRTAFGLAEKGQVIYTDVAKAAKELGISQQDLTQYADDGITAFEALQATMRKTDALEGAQMRMDNLAGDMEIFSGIVDSVKTQIGDKFDPVLRKVFKNITPILSDLGPQLVTLAGNLADTFVVPALDNFIASLQEAQRLSSLTFSVTGEVSSSFMAGLAGLTGGEVTLDADAKVVSVDWGDFSYAYDATSQITSVDWFGNWFTGENGKAGFVYDASASILNVDWSSSLGAQTAFTYDANAGITEVHWNFENFKYNYNATAGITTVDFFSSFFVGTYTATASITDVGWGLYTHFYNASAQINETSVLWGAYTHAYSTNATIIGVGWGLFSHSYDAGAKISDTSVLWGGFTHTYDASASVSEDSIFWGLYSYTYDAKANVTTWTILGKSPSEWVATLSGALDFSSATLPTWTWPSMPSFSWPSLPSWAWPALPSWTWPAMPTFAWPTFPTFTWPSIPMPAWVNQLVALFGGGGVSASRQSAAPAQTQSSGGIWSWITGNASGTDYFEGGWTWVGERGPELLNLPKGSKILSNTESNKMIGQLADGTTAAAANPGAPRQGNVFTAIANAAANFGQAANGIKKAADTMIKATKDLEAGLRKVPGLFGTSQVTDKQMKMAELGIPQNFADDWIRRLTDEVVNGVDWEGVDIKDAALRAGLDPSLPANAILELVTEKWNDKSLFADPKNLDLVNQEAVKAALAAQAQQAAGEQNLLGLFGITPEQAGAAGTATGTAAGTGLLTGITQTLTNGGTGQQIATAIGTGVTPESMTPVGSSVVSGLTAELKKDEYVTQIGSALSALFTGYLDKADAFADVAQRIMARISTQFGNLTGIDLVSKFADSFSAQLGTDEAIASLAKVGEKILELVFRGYLDEARQRNWAEGVNAKGDTSSATTTTTTAGNAIGTRSWRGGPTWVGETGPELVSLPARSRIFSNSESMALAGAGGGDVYVTNHFVINNEIDYERAAYRIADIIRRRR